MELSQLEYFYETAKREHITQTAEELHITQPALSKVIARLEADLGVKLFHREGKSIRLNEYGRVVQCYTEQLLYSIGDMRAELAELADGMAGSVRLGSSFPSHEPNWVLDCIRQFALSRPNVSFSLQQATTGQLHSALEQREIDIAISSAPIRSQGVVWEELFTEPMGIILSAYHPLAARDTLSLTDLCNERFYCNNANSDVQDLTYQFCEQAGFRPNIHFECEFPSFIGEAVSLGYGISVIARRGFLRSLEKKDRQPWETNIVFRPLKEEYCHRICGLAYLSGRSLPRAVREFHAFLLAERKR